jgi:hypothetical protein
LPWRGPLRQVLAIIVSSRPNKINFLGCTPIGTKKLYFQIFDEKTSTIKKLIALIANLYWPLPMKILGV